MKKKMIMTVLVAALTTGFMAGCSTEAISNQGTGNNTELDTAQEKESEETEENSARIYVEKRHEEYRDPTDDTILINIDSAIPVAEGTGMEKMSIAFQEWYEKQVTSMKSDMDSLEKTAEEEYGMSDSTEDGGYWFNPYQLTQTVKLQRSDEKVTSISSQNHTYMGGAHGETVESGDTFDTATGEQLTIGDIVKNEAAFQEMAEAYSLKYVEDLYGKEVLFGGYEDNIKTLIEEPVWYLSDYGLCIVCNTYLIGPHAMGITYITIPYAQLGEYLKAEYMPETDKFAHEFVEKEEVVVDDSEKRVYVTTEASSEDEYSAGAVYLHYGDMQAVVTDFCEYIGEMYLIKEDADHIYALISVDYSSDDYNTYLLQISGDGVTLLDSIQAGLDYNAIVTVDGFYLTSKIDVLGTYSGTKYYTITEDGKFDTQDVVYEFNNGAEISYRASLVTVKDIPAHIAGKEGILESGTTVYPAYTDNNGKFYFLMDNGDEGYFQYEMKTDEFGVTIDGADENDLFEMIPYAG